jgi:hypothetical protein
MLGKCGKIPSDYLDDSLSPAKRIDDIGKQGAEPLQQISAGCVAPPNPDYARADSR